MSIVPILMGQAFEPEQLVVMSQAFEDVCEEIGFKNQAARELVAKTVIRFAESGISDVANLRDATLDELCPGRLRARAVG